MATSPLAVVCAWCGRVVTAAADGAPITHTICRFCLERALARPSVETDPDTSDDLDRVHPPAGYFGDAVNN